MEALDRMAYEAMRETGKDPVRFDVTPAFALDLIRELGVFAPCGGPDMMASLGKGTAKIMGIETRIFRTGTVHDARSRAWCVWSR